MTSLELQFYSDGSDTYHDVFRKKIVAEGAVIEVDFIKCLLGQLHHVTLVVAAVLVLTYDLLTHR